MFIITFNTGSYGLLLFGRNEAVHGKMKNQIRMNYLIPIQLRITYYLTLHTLAESVSYFSLDYRSYLPIVYVYLR